LTFSGSKPDKKFILVVVRSAEGETTFFVGGGQPGFADEAVAAIVLDWR
jgi:hypothetical protein